MKLTHKQIDDYLKEITGRATASKETYRKALRIFISTELDINNESLKEFDTWLETTTYERSGKRHYARSTRHLYVSVLYKFLAWLEATNKPRGFNLSVAKSKLDTVRAKSRRSDYNPRRADTRVPSIITYFEAIELPDKNTPNGPRRRLEILRNRAIAHALLSTGARVSELTAITRNQIANGGVKEVEITGKGGRKRIIFFSDECRAAIRAYCSERKDKYPSLFISHRKGLGQALSRHSVLNIVKHAAAQIGLSENTSPHSFRHWVATDMLNNSVPLEVVQDFLGHADISTTRRVYAHTHKSTLRQHVHQYHERKRKQVHINQMRKEGSEE